MTLFIYLPTIVCVGRAHFLVVSSSSQNQSLFYPNLLLTLLNLPHPTSSHFISIQSPTPNPPTPDITYSSQNQSLFYPSCQSLHVSPIVDTGNNIEVVITNALAPIPPQNTHAMQTQAKSGIFKPKALIPYDHHDSSNSNIIH